jgi:hypothetical protein
MISSRSRSAFARMLRDALRSGLGIAEADWTTQELAWDAAVPGRKVAILTVSSYLFRLIALIHFDDDAATWAHFGGEADGERDLQALHDRVCEFGNVTCGALNREIAKVFPHLGMSTPNVIDRQCVEFIGHLGAGLAHHLRVQLADGLVLHARVAVCEYADIDFDLPAPTEGEAVQEAETGELELF